MVKMGYPVEANESRTRLKTSGKESVGHVTDQMSFFLGDSFGTEGQQIPRGDSSLGP